MWDASVEYEYSVIMCSSPEYNTLCELTDVLRLAVKSNLTNLSGALLAKHLILPTDDSELRNQMHSEASRAARLVELIQMKVCEDPQQYYTFIQVLEDQGRQYYASILKKLREKFEGTRSSVWVYTIVRSWEITVKSEMGQAIILVPNVGFYMQSCKPMTVIFFFHMKLNFM